MEVTDYAQIANNLGLTFRQYTPDEDKVVYRFEVDDLVVHFVNYNPTQAEIIAELVKQARKSGTIRGIQTRKALELVELKRLLIKYSKDIILADDTV